MAPAAAMALAKPISNISASYEETKSLELGLAQLHHTSRIKGELDALEKTQLSDNNWGILSDSDKLPEYDPQHCPGVCASTDNALTPLTMQQADRLSPPLCLQSTHTQAKGVKSEVARFDAVLEKIQEQKMLVERLAARQAVTRKQQEEVSKKAEVAKAETDQLQRRTQASVTHSQSYTQAPLCSHQVFWTKVAGRSRCEYHSYSPRGYRNPFRFRCPGCNTIACGLCMKKLKRGDALS
ncbi:hypothetical protein EJ02DRAFT_272056 [Clathrospora elynae]|uniref:Uncharacterized protein n=1 Tax=Clathrospora elynae TaxID=706981 RepID=A0A6A5SG28_9PLEO|nr:hypothetical protein EJ02DRAFT_272056 [Clathrospora elynae]